MAQPMCSSISMILWMLLGSCKWGIDPRVMICCMLGVSRCSTRSYDAYARSKPHQQWGCHALLDRQNNPLLSCYANCG